MTMLTEGIKAGRNTDPCTPEIGNLLLRIQGEYLEMPGLSVTLPQAQRLWGIDRSTCVIVLLALVERRFLRRTSIGAYVRT